MAYQSEIEKLESRFREKPEQWFAALADAYRKAGDLDMALDVLNAWIGKRPNYTSGHIVLGRCLLDRGQDADAAEAFENVLQLDMENVIALKSLSEIAARRADPDGAKRWLQRLLEVDPMNEEARAALDQLGGEGV
ncbi:MAG: tetratricopeptide repeat protein, partial [Gemmatimonadota bacterium]|nr:tetratricopeptide repeat protein [Gemmatimonadota bacterium]